MGLLQRVVRRLLRRTSTRCSCYEGVWCDEAKQIANTLGWYEAIDDA